MPDDTTDQPPSWLMGTLAAPDRYDQQPSPAWPAIGQPDRAASPLAGLGPEGYVTPDMPLTGAPGALASLAKGIYGVVSRTTPQYVYDERGNAVLNPEFIQGANSVAQVVVGGGLGAAEEGPGTILGAGRVRRPPPANPRAVIGGNNPPPDFKFAQYAEEYPPVGPPVLKTDPKKLAAGVEDPTYWGKQLTPEAKVFQKERNKIMEDMAQSGYTPFFDTSQRFHVDPTDYPPNVDTLAITPKKQATIDKYWIGTEAKPGLDSELVRDRLRAGYQRGSEMPDTANWYAMGQLEKAFRDELGDEAGRKAFQDRFATSMAATTGGADPTANYLMAQYGNYLRAKGMSVPEASHQYPFPIGGQYAGTNMDMFQKVMDAGGFPGLGAANPKRHNFAQNFTGNRGVATMDEQMVSGMTPGVSEPGDKYGLYERVVREEAAKLGIDPANYQDVAWAGFKNLKDPTYTSGKPMMAHVNDAIERTHRLTGMPKDEILKRGIIRSEIPVYGLAAGLMAPGVMGGLAAQDRYDQ